MVWILGLEYVVATLRSKAQHHVTAGLQALKTPQNRVGDVDEGQSRVLSGLEEWSLGINLYSSLDSLSRLVDAFGDALVECDLIAGRGS